MHKYSIALRIVDETGKLDIDIVTNELGLNPTLTRRKGERKSKKHLFEESVWDYSVSQPGSNGGWEGDWEDIEVGLNALLDIFQPKLDKLNEYKEKYYVVLWCGHFSSSSDGGPTLSPALLKRLGEFGVELFIDTYFSNGDFESENSAGRPPHQ